MISYPFLGAGIIFPLQIDDKTGGIKTGLGGVDYLAVTAAYIQDRWTILDYQYDTSNIIVSSIFNIILTRLGEHDTLPWYGSDLHSILFEPISRDSISSISQEIATCTERWEKRVIIDRYTGITWGYSDLDVDHNTVLMRLQPIFIDGQVLGNLVVPYASEYDIRVAEYPQGVGDATGYDWCSRYKWSHIVGSDKKFIRCRKVMPIAPAADDIFVRVGQKDTLLLIAYTVYGDIRLWWVLADILVQERDGKRTGYSNFNLPPAGTIVRLPSKARLFTEIVT
jgi:phage baseplate assembly protein W